MKVLYLTVKICDHQSSVYIMKVAIRSELDGYSRGSISATHPAVLGSILGAIRTYINEES